MKSIAILTLSTVIVLIACRPVRKIQTVVSKPIDTATTIAITDPTIDSAAVKAAIFEKVNQNHINYNTFFSEIKFDYTDLTGKNSKATAFVRIKKDSIVWISVTGLMGIEGYRIMVTPDTVMIMDKIKKTIAYRSVSYLQEIIKIPVDFYTLQDLLVGNPVFFANNITSYRNNGNSLVALSVGSYFKHLITMDTANGRISNSKLDDVQEVRLRTCNIALGDYANIQGRNFSQYREISVTEKTKLDILLDFKKVEFDSDQNFPFNIPKNYGKK